MRSYKILNALPPEAFLNPADFVTAWGGEKDTAYLAKQREVALEASWRAYETGGHVYVSANGAWGASGPGWFISTYEGIGYHAGTAAVLEGLLEGPAAFDVYRDVDGKVTRTRIKEPRPGVACVENA